MQAKACTVQMARREERIEGLTPDLGAHAATIVGKQNFDAVLARSPHLDGDSTFLTVQAAEQAKRLSKEPAYKRSTHIAFNGLPDQIRPHS
jgi:hypothetical protein